MSSIPRDVLHAHGMRRRLGAPTQPVGTQHGVHCGRHFGRFLQVTTPPPRSWFSLEKRKLALTGCNCLVTVLLIVTKTRERLVS